MPSEAYSMREAIEEIKKILSFVAMSEQDKLLKIEHVIHNSSLYSED